MLAEKEWLLLCEFAELDIWEIQGESIGRIADTLYKSNQYKNNFIVKEVIVNQKIKALQVKKSKIIDKARVTIFEDSQNNKHILFQIKGEEDKRNIDLIERAAKFCANNIGEGTCIITGLKLGGLYAAYIAERLNINGVVFGAPSNELIVGNVQNYVLENEIVGKYIDKIIFVKQNTQRDDTDAGKTYYEMFTFNDNGQVITGEQSAYSKYISWFYDNMNAIDEEIWKIFFGDIKDPDTLMNNDLYSIYFNIDKLKPEKVIRALKNIQKHTENELMKNRKMMKIKLEKNRVHMDDDDFVEKIYKITEVAVINANEIIKNIYDNVKIILMGIELFTLPQNLHYNTEELMKELGEYMEQVLEKEIELVEELINSEKKNYIEAIINFNFTGSIYDD